MKNSKNIMMALALLATVSSAFANPFVNRGVSSAFASQPVNSGNAFLHGNQRLILNNQPGNNQQHNRIAGSRVTVAPATPFVPATPLGKLRYAEGLIMTPRTEENYEEVNQARARGLQMLEELAGWCRQIVAENNYNYLDNDIVTITEFFFNVGSSRAFFTASNYQSIFVPAVIRTVINIANELIQGQRPTNSNYANDLDFLVRLTYALVSNPMRFDDAPELKNQLGNVFRTMNNHTQMYVRYMQNNHPEKYAFIAGWYRI